MDAIPPEYDKSTKQRIYRQEWLEYFNYIGWDRAIREHPEHYYAIFPPGSAQGPYGTSTMSGVLTDPLGVHDTPDPVSAAAPILVNQRLTDNVPYGGAILAPPVSVTASAAAKLFLDDGSTSSGSSGSRSFSNTSSSSSSVSSRDERNDAGVSRGHRRHQRDAEGDGGDADDKKTSSRRRHRDSSNTKRRSRHRHRDRSKRRSGHRDRKAGRKRDREHDYEKSGDEKSARHEERSARREERRARGDHHSNGEDGHRHRQRPHRSERGERGRSRDRDRDRDKEREREKGRGREKDRNRDRDRDRDRPLPSGGADGHKGHYILKEGSDRWRGKGGNPHGAAADQYDDRKEDARQRRQRDEARRRR